MKPEQSAPTSIDLDYLITPESLAKAEKILAERKRKKQRRKTQPVLDPLPPPTIDWIPIEVVLMWNQWSCTCGSTWEGPAYSGTSQFVRRQEERTYYNREGKRARTSRFPNYSISPLNCDSQHPLVPRRLEVRQQSVKSCRHCHTQGNPHQLSWPIVMSGDTYPLVRAQEAYYQGLLETAQDALPPPKWPEPVGYSMDEFKEDLSQYADGAYWLGKEIGTEVALWLLREDKS